MSVDQIAINMHPVITSEDEHGDFSLENHVWVKPFFILVLVFLILIMSLRLYFISILFILPGSISSFS